MKSPDFEYARVKNLADVFALQKLHGESAQILAGGQSLLAVMNLRMANPQVLIDIGDLHELRGIEHTKNTVRIGALTTHHNILTSAVVQQHIPLLAQAVPHVAHLAIRNKGTIGGSLALGDPAAEYPAVALALNATLILKSAKSERRVSARDFFISLYRTAVKPDEILVAVEFPVATSDQRFVFLELSRRKGDYAIVGLAATFTLKGKTVSDCALAYMSVDDKPVLAPLAMEAMEGQTIDASSIAQAQKALDKDLNPAGDLQGNTATKKQLARVLLSRALMQAGEQHV